MDAWGEIYLNGNIEYFDIWNISLNPDEIIDVMNNNNLDNDLTDIGLIARYKINEGSDYSAIYDDSGNQNHGSINGAIWLGSTQCEDNYIEVDGNCYWADDYSIIEDFGEYFEGQNLLDICNLTWNEEGRLIVLNCSSLNLLGEIPSDISQLEYLERQYNTYN